MPPDLLRKYAVKLSAERNTPVSMDEAKEEIIQSIFEVASLLSNSLSFGYHQREDVIQEAYRVCLEAFQAEKYLVELPLKNFLYCHIRNRLLNLKRKQFFRRDAPCKCCDQWNPGPNPCERWVVWNRLNERKQRIMRPMSLSGDSPFAAPTEDPSEGLVLGELTSYIEERLDPALLEDYRALLDETPLDKARRNRVRAALRAILKDTPYDPT